LAAASLWPAARAAARPEADTQVSVRAAAAASCAKHPWVEVSFDGPGWPAVLRVDAREELEAGLRLRGIGLCPAGAIAVDAGTAPAPVARAGVRLDSADHPWVSIDIQDAVTNKRVLRDIDLRAVASDARALVVAQAVDELLRASWVELTLPTAPKPTMPPPPAIARAIELPARGAPERLQVLGARFASEFYTGGVHLLGADAHVDFWLSERLALAIALGMRLGPRATAPHGSVSVSALTAGVDLQWPVWPRSSSFNLLLSVGGYVAELTLTGRASGERNTRARTRSDFVVSGRCGLSLVWRITELLRLDLTGGPGVAFRGLAATDNGSDIISTRGLELHGALGVGGLF
jgi:hypothetical protein